MTIDINDLRRLAQAVSEWSNCNQAWLDQSEDVPAATVGHIDEDGNTYPIATIDCDQYYAAHQSLPLAKFYAAANPATVAELLDRLEAAEKSDAESPAVHRRARDERDSLRAEIERMEKQEPYSYIYEYANPIDGSPVWRDTPGYWNAQYPRSSRPLYALPGAQPQLNEIRTALQRALELGARETWTGARKHRSWEDQREEQQCWNKVWSLLGAQGEEK